jgi:hypothetical protein
MRTSTLRLTRTLNGLRCSKRFRSTPRRKYCPEIAMGLTGGVPQAPRGHEDPRVLRTPRSSWQRAYGEPVISSMRRSVCDEDPLCRTLCCLICRSTIAGAAFISLPESTSTVVRSEMFHSTKDKPILHPTGLPGLRERRENLVFEALPSIQLSEPSSGCASVRSVRENLVIVSRPAPERAFPAEGLRIRPVCRRGNTRESDQCLMELKDAGSKRGKLQRIPAIGPIWDRRGRPSARASWRNRRCCGQSARMARVSPIPRSNGFDCEGVVSWTAKGTTTGQNRLLFASLIVASPIVCTIGVRR